MGHDAAVNTSRPEAARRGARPTAPISMLRWRRQTHAFDETAPHAASAANERCDGNAAAGAHSTVASDAAPNERAEKPVIEKPVIIRAAKTASASGVGEGARDRTGIRSKAGRIVLIAAIGATLFASLAVVAPTGAGAGLPAVLTSYANAMPWRAPTPTARTTGSATSAGVTTNVSGGTPSQQAIIADIQSVFGPYASGALNVARCESSFDPHAWNPTPVAGSHASGVFQILYPATWNGTSYRGYSPYDEWANVRAAYEIFKRDGYSWREWQCKP